MYQFIFAPYFDNFNVYSQELIPSEDVKSHIWKHLILLIGSIMLGLLICVILLKHVFGINIMVRTTEENTEELP